MGKGSVDEIRRKTSMSYCRSMTENLLGLSGFYICDFVMQQRGDKVTWPEPVPSQGRRMHNIHLDQTQSHCLFYITVLYEVGNLHFFSRHTVQPIQLGNACLSVSLW